MILVDVNVLVYAHREDAADHERFRTWLERARARPRRARRADRRREPLDVRYLADIA